ncbi:MAG: CPBP family intramembrane metalloprotease [Planctomycetes bacterium]|nr:CPBP family intramembrane metalloprotease [Planctomycetota bacterium]
MNEQAHDEHLSYWTESRSLSLSVVTMLPLVVVYHLGIVQTGYQERLLAELWLEGPLHLVGLHAAQIINFLLLVALILVLLRSDLKGSLSRLTIGIVMIAEAALYSLVLYRGGHVLTGLLYERARSVIFTFHFSDYAPHCLALGAGVYEEVLFRLLLLGGASVLLASIFRWDKRLSTVVALLFSSLLFAAVHNIGSLGEPFTAYNFLFRTVCGLALGVIYLGRGLGVAAWTHAIYNMLVLSGRLGA